MDVWPALPLVVRDDMSQYPISGMDNIVAVLGQSNRVCDVYLAGLAGWQLEEVLAAMQVPFPELTDLVLSLAEDHKPVPVIPDSFLDGSAPCLRNFDLEGIPFPGLPKLLLSATHLVSLRLFNIPHSVYISPEAIVALISMLSSLETLYIKFQSTQSRPDRESRRLPPPKRSILPALDHIYFAGVIEYIEDLVTRIDTPQLRTMYIHLFNQIDFDTPRLAQFIDRTCNVRESDAHVQFHDDFAAVKHAPWSVFHIALSGREPDWQLSSIEQVCNSSLPPLSIVEDLYIEHRYSHPVWKDDTIENTLWLQLLRPFTAVKNLCLSKEFAPGIAAALQELVGERIIEVLPNLQNIFVKGLEQVESGPFEENIGQFVAARQLSNHPIAISGWDGSGWEDPDGDED